LFEDRISVGKVPEGRLPVVIVSVDGADVAVVSTNWS